MVVVLGLVGVVLDDRIGSCLFLHLRPHST
jgi:hypothetical protein